MNSSSAFSNVLSASPVQPKANMLAQRHVSDDDSNVEFKRTLDDVRSEQRSEQDVKPKESCAKKITSADKRSKAKPDEVAAPDNTTASAEKPASQLADKSTVKNGEGKSEEDKSDDTLVSEDETKKADSSEDTQVAAILALPIEPAAQALIPAGVVTASADTVQNADSPTLEQGSTPITTESVIETSPSANIANPLTPDTGSSLVADAAQEPQQQTVAPVVSAITATVTDATNVAVVAGDTEAADVVASAGVDILKSGAAKIDPFAGETDSASPVSDDSAATTTDPKAVFEKMLQAMSNNASTNSNAGGNSQGSPDSQARATDTIASVNSANSAAASVIDSLVRGADAQSPAARSFVVQTSVPVPVGQPQWSQAVGEKVLWLAAQNVHSAEIRLDPPELGPMQVKISVNQEQTSVNFTSHHAGVREVLDQNLGRLRDMFNEQGLNLVNVDVSDRSFQRHQGEGGEQKGQGNHAEQDDEESPVAISTIVQQRLVDHYA